MVRILTQRTKYYSYTKRQPKMLGWANISGIVSGFSTPRITPYSRHTGLLRYYTDII